MKFVESITRAHSMIIDGYSNAKTINGAISDFGKYIVKHYGESEGKSLIEFKKDCLLPIRLADAKGDDECYFFTIESVSCASKLNEDSGEIEYAEGNWYLCIRIVTN